MNSTTESFFSSSIEDSAYYQVVFEVNKVKHAVLLFSFGIIIFIGLIGNGFCIYAQFKMYRSDGLTPSSLSIFCLTLFNFLSVLIGATNHWFTEVIPFSIRNYATWACKTHFFFTRLLTETSIWFQVIYSLMRVIAVTWPHKTHLILSMKITKIVLILAIFLVTLSDFPRALANNIVQYEWGVRCLIADRNLAYIFTVFHFFTVLVIPDLILFFTTILVGYQMGIAIKAKSSLIHSQISTSDVKEMLAEESARGSTRYMFLNNFTLIILYAPYLVYKVYEAFSRPYLRAFSYEEASFYDFIYRLANIPLFLYHAIYWSFLLTGSKYRNAFLNNLRCLQ